MVDDESAGWRRLKRADIEARSRCVRNCAFTLVEMLLVVTTLAVLSGLAMMAIQNAHESARVTKLQHDVATINAAIQVYEASGGTLASASTPEQVLATLKTSASQAMPGLRGSMVDRRLFAEFQSAGEAASAQPRALWNGSRFEVAMGGGAGVKNFRLDDEMASVDFGTESRNPALPVANGGNGGNWIWSYQDPSPASRPPPVFPATGTPPAYIAPTAPTASPLSPPEAAPPGGAYDLIAYANFTVTLSNPNPAGVSQIDYSIDGAAWQLYRGETIPIEPGTTIAAYARSIDPDHWFNSTVATHEYTANPVTLQIAIEAPSSLTYEQAGGQMIGGSASESPTAVVTLTNAADIPNKYQKSENFEFRWTVDGSDPLTSATAETSQPFLNGAPPQSIDISLARWGEATSLTVRAVAKAVDGSLFVDSEVQEAVISMTPTPLEAPVVGVEGVTYFPSVPVPIELATGAQYPVGARIFYTTDGTDPGDNNGHPVTGTLYGGPVPLDSPGFLKARVYGPLGHEAWFTPSPVASREVVSEPPSPPVTMLVPSSPKRTSIFRGSIPLIARRTTKAKEAATLRVAPGNKAGRSAAPELPLTRVSFGRQIHG